MLAASAAAIALQGVGAGLAHAQLETRSNSPIDITADQAEVVQSKCIAIWRGAAEALQDQSRLRADTITVYSRHKPPGAAKPTAQAQGAGLGADATQGDCGAADRIEADGHVYYVTPEREARGNHAAYTQSNDQIVMTGDVIVVQGQNVARGDKLIIDVSSHQARMVSDVTGLGKQGRVRGVYFPEKTAPANGATAKP
jgi:lipopolysaccharide export system protein LptA